MGVPPLPAPTAERFRRDWYAATGAACADKALVALSGGPDSSALLLLFAGALRGSVNPFAAATVDHGLRPASAAEAERAARLAHRCGVEHRILSGPLPERVGRVANLSARARALRYALLEAHAREIGARWIITAHHADDQLETLVMRLNRGSGVGGLAGIRITAGRVVRPLLSWRRAELNAIVAAAGVDAVNDPSNHDDRFDRARLRKALAAADWLDPLKAARSAAACADADAALDWMVDALWAEHVQLGLDQAILRPALLPAEIIRRLVARCLRHVDAAADVGGRPLDRLIAGLRGGEQAMLGNVLASPVLPGPGAGWLFRRAPPRRSP